MNFMSALGNEDPTAVQDGTESLKGSHRKGDGPMFLKTSMPLPLIRCFRMRPFLARSMALNWTFKWLQLPFLQYDSYWFSLHDEILVCFDCCLQYLSSLTVLNHNMSVVLVPLKKNSFCCLLFPTTIWPYQNMHAAVVPYHNMSLVGIPGRNMYAVIIFHHNMSAVVISYSITCLLFLLP